MLGVGEVWCASTETPAQGNGSQSYAAAAGAMSDELATLSLLHVRKTAITAHADMHERLRAAGQEDCRCVLLLCRRRSLVPDANPRGGKQPYESAEGHNILDMRFCEPHCNPAGRKPMSACVGVGCTSYSAAAGSGHDALVCCRSRAQSGWAEGALSGASTSSARHCRGHHNRLAAGTSHAKRSPVCKLNNKARVIAEMSAASPRT